MPKISVIDLISLISALASGGKNLLADFLAVLNDKAAMAAFKKIRAGTADPTLATDVQEFLADVIADLKAAQAVTPPPAPSV